MDDIHHIIERTFIQKAGRVTASLMSTLGDLDLVEDMLQEAFVVALERWPRDGIPPNPVGWLTVTARRKAIDRLRRDTTLAQKETILASLLALDQPRQDESAMDEIPDERLKLIFTCCHPALAVDAQIALTLRTLGGLSTEEIARAFLVPTATMAKRLVRAKGKIKAANIPYRVPPLHLLNERLQAVLHVIYLIFNEGYVASQGDALIRHELCHEAIRLNRVLVNLVAQEQTLSESAEALGLLALMLLHDSRRSARLSKTGDLIALDEQDRSRWDDEQIAEGLAILHKAMHLRANGPYQIQAAISALHAQAKHPAATDWPQIAALYGRLARMTPSPVVLLNHAVAIAEAHGIEQGLALLAEPQLAKQLENYVSFHAARAALYRRAGQLTDAHMAYARAIELAQNAVELSFLKRQQQELRAMLN